MDVCFFPGEEGQKTLLLYGGIIEVVRVETLPPFEL